MLKKSLMKIFESDFVRNVLLLMGGSLIAQVISMGSAPILTRLFTPENFGVLGLFMAIVNIGSQVGSLCYERAIVLPKKDEEAVNVFSFSLLLLSTITVIVFLAILAFHNQILILFKKVDFGIWIWFIPLGLFLNSLFLNMKFWYIRQKRYKVISWANIAEAAVSASTKIVIGIIIGAVAGGLIGGFLLGVFVASCFLVSKSPLFDLEKYRPHISWQKMKTLARTYKKFPLFASWNILLNSFSRHLVVFMFSVFFSAEIVGFYNLGSSILGRPVFLVSQSVQNVFFQKAAQDLANKVQIRRSLAKTTLGLMAIGFLPFLILAVLGRQLFIIIFGSNWETAGLYVQIMAPWFFVWFISSPANVVYEVCQKQDIRLYLNIALTVLRLAGLMGGYYIFNEAQGSLAMYMGASILVQAAIIIVGFDIARKTDKRSEKYG
jgi:O-antigen/teichoic acid export membrane protein